MTDVDKYDLYIDGRKLTGPGTPYDLETIAFIIQNLENGLIIEGLNDNFKTIKIIKIEGE